MGLFDRVWVYCPVCYNPIQFQSKAGDCKLRDFNAVEDVPLAIAADLHNTTEHCENCGMEVKLRIPGVSEIVAMDVLWVDSKR